MTSFFSGSEKPSIGIEIELQLLNPESLNLVPESKKVLTACQSLDVQRVKCEVHKSMIEIDSEISENVKECREFLTNRLKALFKVCSSLNIELGTTATHPFQKWEDRIISEGARYEMLHEKYRWLFRRMNVYGLHVHVGIRSGERALAISKKLQVFLPTF